MNFAATSSQPLPGGHVFQPITPELVALLKRADCTLARLIPVLERQVPKVLQSRTAVGQRLNLVRLNFHLARAARETNNENAMDVFVLTHDLKRSAALLDQGRDSLLRAAWAEFNKLGVGEFGRLSKAAGDYFGQWFYADMAKRGAR